MAVKYYKKLFTFYCLYVLMRLSILLFSKTSGGGLISIYYQMLAEQQRIQKEKERIQKQIFKLPVGNIFCFQNGSSVKWYKKDGKQRQYLPKSKRKYAEQLAVKKYLLLRMKELIQEERAVISYLSHHRESASEQMLKPGDPYAELLAPYFQPESSDLQSWMESPYEQNKKYPEQKIYGTSAGIHVRSKSESMIVYLLHDYKIPFRYESELELGQVTVYPDFTIRHPKTGKLFLWEHLGLMGDPTYRRNALSKLQLYMEHGWVPSVNLILTYETKEYPLDMAYVEGLIKDYFVVTDCQRDISLTGQCQ